MRESEKLPKEFLLRGVERMRTSEHSVVAEEGARDYAARMAVERVKTGQDEGHGMRNERLTRGKAKRLRKNLTDAESKLWRHIRLRQIGGFKFRRQHPVGPYILDFACVEKLLAIEVDGGQHGEYVMISGAAHTLKLTATRSSDFGTTTCLKMLRR